MKSGGHTRLANLVKGLGSRHELFWLSLHTPGESAKIERIQGLLEDPILVLSRNNETLWDKVSDACHPGRWKRTVSRSLGRLRGLPREVVRMDFPELSRVLERQLLGRRFDLVQFEYTAMAPYSDVVRECSPQTAVVLEEIDISYIAMQRTLDFDADVDRADLCRQLDKMKRFERAQWNRFDAVAVMSEVERLEVIEACKASRVFVVPNGVDTSHFSFSLRKKEMQPSILFLGSLIHPPNRIGLKAFLARIWPEILKKTPGVKLDVVGEGANEDLRSLASGSVVFHGFVDDIRPVLSKSSILVVPIWTGSGTRLKVLEAFSSGLPVVSTRLGCEGLDAKSDEHFLAAESPSDFVKSIERLIHEQDSSRRIAFRARRLVEESYDWEVVGKQAESAWKSAIGNLQPPR